MLLMSFFNTEVNVLIYYARKRATLVFNLFLTPVNFTVEWVGSLIFLPDVMGHLTLIVFYTGKDVHFKY